MLKDIVKFLKKLIMFIIVIMMIIFMVRGTVIIAFLKDSILLLNSWDLVCVLLATFSYISVFWYVLDDYEPQKALKKEEKDESSSKETPKA